MASRQDQLHSYQFSVQRVVSALVMGDTDPVRSPFRRIAGATLAGILLAAVSLGAVAVFGVLSPGGGTDWRNGNAVIVERESGARYVFTGGVLHPVPNYTSALLVIGSADAHPVTVSRGTLAAVSRGAPLGIPGAPDPLPAADKLLGAPWTLCSARFGDGPARSALYLGRAPAGGTGIPDGTGLLEAVRRGTPRRAGRGVRAPGGAAARRLRYRSARAQSRRLHREPERHTADPDRPARPAGEAPGAGPSARGRPRPVRDGRRR